MSLDPGLFRLHCARREYLTIELIHALDFAFEGGHRLALKGTTRPSRKRLPSSPTAAWVATGGAGFLPGGMGRATGANTSSRHRGAHEKKYRRWRSADSGTSPSLLSRAIGPLRGPMRTGARPRALRETGIPNAASRPGWGPFIEMTPNYVMPAPEVGFGIQACFVIGCVAFERGQRGSNSLTISTGVALELAITAGVSSQDANGWYLVGECSATALVGAGAQFGVGLSDGPHPQGGIKLNGSGSGSVRFGGGGGCSAGVKYSW